MKASYAGPLSLAAILVATPVTASPAFIVLAAALATAVGVSASQQPYETWQYTSTYGWVRAECALAGEDAGVPLKRSPDRNIASAGCPSIRTLLGKPAGRGM